MLIETQPKDRILILAIRFYITEKNLTLTLTLTLTHIQMWTVMAHLIVPSANHT